MKRSTAVVFLRTESQRGSSVKDEKCNDLKKMAKLDSILGTQDTLHSKRKNLFCKNVKHVRLCGNDTLSESEIEKNVQ